MWDHGIRFHCRAIFLDVLRVWDLGVVVGTVRWLTTATTDAVADRCLLVTSTADVDEDRNVELIDEDHGHSPSQFYQRCWSNFARDFAALSSRRRRTNGVVEAEGISMDRCHT